LNKNLSMLYNQSRLFLFLATLEMIDCVWTPSISCVNFLYFWIVQLFKKKNNCDIEIINCMIAWTPIFHLHRKYWQGYPPPNMFWLHYNKRCPCKSSDFTRFWVNSLVVVTRDQWKNNVFIDLVNRNYGIAPTFCRSVGQKISFDSNMQIDIVHGYLHIEFV
jgi:hypothetical protein